MNNPLETKATRREFLFRAAKATAKTAATIEAFKLGLKATKVRAETEVPQTADNVLGIQIGWQTIAMPDDTSDIEKAKIYKLPAYRLDPSTNSYVQAKPEDYKNGVMLYSDSSMGISLGKGVDATSSYDVVSGTQIIANLSGDNVVKLKIPDGDVMYALVNNEWITPPDNMLLPGQAAILMSQNGGTIEQDIVDRSLYPQAKGGDTNTSDTPTPSSTETDTQLQAEARQIIDRFKQTGVLSIDRKELMPYVSVTKTPEQARDFQIKNAHGQSKVFFPIEASTFMQASSIKANFLLYAYSTAAAIKVNGVDTVNIVSPIAALPGDGVVTGINEQNYGNLSQDTQKTIFESLSKGSTFSGLNPQNSTFGLIVEMPDTAQISQYPVNPDNHPTFQPVDSRVVFAKIPGNSTLHLQPQSIYGSELKDFPTESTVFMTTSTIENKEKLDTAGLGFYTDDKTGKLIVLSITN